MKPLEKRELLIWGGMTALVLLLVNGWVLSGKAQQVRADESRLQTAYDEYHRHYGDAVSESAIPVDEALVAYATARDAQLAALRVVELGMLGGTGFDRRQLDDRLSAELIAALGPIFADELARAPGMDGADDRAVALFLVQSLQQSRARSIAREFVADGRMVDFSRPVSYNAAGTLVGNTHTRLLRRAATAMVAFPRPERLPLQGAGAIAVGDDPGAAAERSLQMAEVCCYATLTDLVLEVFEFGDEHRRITDISTGGAAVRRSSPDGRYAVVGASMSLVAGYEAVKTIMERLYGAYNGLFVRRFSMRQDGDSGAFVVDLEVGLVIPHHDEWQLSPWPQVDAQPASGHGERSRPSRPATRPGTRRR